jgi:hypothetical protein
MLIIAGPRAGIERPFLIQHRRMIPVQPGGAVRHVPHLEELRSVAGTVGTLWAEGRSLPLSVFRGSMIATPSMEKL